MKSTSITSTLNTPTLSVPPVFAAFVKEQPTKANPMKQSRLHCPIVLSLALSGLLLWQAPLQAAGQDDQIEAAAQSSYVFKTFLTDEAIKTEAKDGVVTLSGVVTADSHKYLAENTVSSLPGVTSVVNLITVKEGAPEYSDTWLYLKVKSALAMHRSLSVFSTKVVMKEGVVTLKGEASSQAQKELATEYAKDVDGIKGVNNEMTVATTPEKPVQTIAEMIDDASITAQVRVALLSHRSTSALTTSVSTLAGVVTVGGKAANVAEKDLVTKLVIDINGVVSVVNNMKVEPAVSKQ
jgi:hyperosmotically inducible periplasmic protein